MRAPGSRRSADATRQPVVAVPARNEAERLPRLLAALSAQTWLHRGERLDVVIVLNNCTDGSARLLTDLAPAHPALALTLVDVILDREHAHVGVARRMAMDAALGGRSPERVALVTTDADATPEPGWIDANLAALANGADLVGGHIVGDPAEEARLGPGFRRRVDRHLEYVRLTDRLADQLDPQPHDPAPRHSDHTGASLAVRGEVYVAVGGLPPLPFREDVAFVRRVRAAGYRLRHCADVRVKVSARLNGRAPGGMADCLKSWIKAEADGEPHLVEAVAALTARFELRRALRDSLPLPHAFVDSASTEHLGLDATGPWAPSAMIELFAGDELDAIGDTPVEVAIAELRRLLEETEHHADAA